MVKQKKIIRSFTLYFTSREELNKAKEIADKSHWCADYDIVTDMIDEGEYAIVEFWWDDITIESLDYFLTELSK